MNKLYLIATGALLSGIITIQAQEWKPQQWPVLKKYDKEHLYQIALPFRRYRNWYSIARRAWRTTRLGNNECPGKEIQHSNHRNNALCFAIYAKPQNQKATTTLLAGPLYSHEYLLMKDVPVNHHGLPRFEQSFIRGGIPFRTSFFIGQQSACKRVKGFNPFIPGDADASGLPVAVLSYEVTNTTDQPMNVSICGSIRNFIGKDGSKFRTDWKGGLHSYRSKEQQEQVC